FPREKSVRATHPFAFAMQNSISALQILEEEVSRNNLTSDQIKDIQGKYEKYLAIRRKLHQLAGIKKDKKDYIADYYTSDEAKKIERDVREANLMSILNATELFLAFKKQFPTEAQCWEQIQDLPIIKKLEQATPRELAEYLKSRSIRRLIK